MALLHGVLLTITENEIVPVWFLGGPLVSSFCFEAVSS